MHRQKGTPKTGGRVRGTPNKTSQALREAAGKYTLEGLANLVTLMRTSTDEDIKFRAIQEILNRAVGKPAQAILHSDNEGGPLRLTDMSLEELKTLVTRLTHALADDPSAGGRNAGD